MFYLTSTVGKLKLSGLLLEKFIPQSIWLGRFFWLYLSNDSAILLHPALHREH